MIVTPPVYDYCMSATTRPKNAEARAASYAERRATVDQIKLECGCADCGYRDHPAALEFDHRDPSEKRMGGIAKHLTRRWEVILAEIAKCEVVCANCHAIRTATLRAAQITGQVRTRWRDLPSMQLKPDRNL